MIPRLLAALIVTIACGACSEMAGGDADRTPRGSSIALSGEPLARRIWAGHAVQPSIRPSLDGRRVSVIDPSTGAVVVRDLVDGTDRPVAVPSASERAAGDFADASVISPSGEWIAFSWWNGTTDRFELRLIDRAGGRARSLVRDARFEIVMPLAWSRDETRIAVALPRADGSMELGTVSLDGALTIVSPVDLPDPGGGLVQFTDDNRALLLDSRQRRARTDSADVVAIAVTGGHAWPVVAHPGNDRFAGLTADGRAVLFFSDRGGTTSLYAQPVTAGLRPDGNPLLVRRDVWSGHGVGVTASGSLLFTVQTGVRMLYAAQLDTTSGTASNMRALVEVGYGTRAAAADWIAGGASTIQNFRPGRTHGGRALIVRSITSGDAREVPAGMIDLGSLLASPDGAHVLVTGRDRTRQLGVFAVSVGNGATTVIATASAEPARMVRSAGWSPDSRTAFYTAEEFSQNRLRLVARELASQRERTVLEIPCTSWCSGRVSPDGRQFAMLQSTSEVPAATRVLVASTTGGELREVARVAPGGSLSGVPAWTPDSRTIIIAYAESDGARVARLLVAPVDGATPRTVTVDVEGMVTGVRVHPDGRQLLFFAGEPAFELWSLDQLHFKPSP